MKHIITSFALLALAFSASARHMGSKKIAAVKQLPNVFQNTRLQVSGDNLHFSNLPKKDMEMYIMDDQGVIEQTAVVSSKKNKVSISELPSGNHVIALKMGLKIKVFGFLAEVTTKG